MLFEKNLNSTFDFSLILRPVVSTLTSNANKFPIPISTMYVLNIHSYREQTLELKSAFDLSFEYLGLILTHINFSRKVFYYQTVSFKLNSL